jgi:hypothetical protein
LRQVGAGAWGEKPCQEERRNEKYLLLVYRAFPCDSDSGSNIYSTLEQKRINEVK